MTNRSKILHIFGWDKKFVLPFIQFVEENFGLENHHFIINGDVTNSEIPPGKGIVLMPKLLKNAVALTMGMHAARKIIIHGLFNSQLLYILFFQPWLLKKCYWVIWGGDLYIRNANHKDWRWKKNEFFRSCLIRRFGHLISHIKGDYELAQKWYNAKGEWHECFMYPSNLYQEPPINSAPHDEINILLGNSADPSNRHTEILDLLKCHTNENIKIYCPLSYGNEHNAQYISEYGTKLFGDKFIAIRTFMPLKEYNKLLAKMDIAIFNHSRQQGMGNTTTLLGMGKKVFMRKEVTPYSMFSSIGVTVYSVEHLDLAPIEKNIAHTNQKNVMKYFSSRQLKKQWTKIYG